MANRLAFGLELSSGAVDRIFILSVKAKAASEQGALFCCQAFEPQNAGSGDIYGRNSISLAVG